MCANGLARRRGTCLALTIYSIVDSANSAERHNAELRRRRFVLTPAPVVGPDHSTGVGMQLGASF